MDSSNKILCFGCSHSIGPYDNNNKVVDYNGWIKYLSDNINTDKNWRGVSLPGCGLAHYTLLIDRIDLSNVSDIIIQHTSEPRLTYKIYKDDYNLDKFIYTVSKSLETEKKYSTHILPGYCINLFSKDIIDTEELRLLNSIDTTKRMSDNLSLVMDTYTQDLWTTGIIDILLNSMIENIKTICDKNSVKLHQISWKENITKLIKEYNLLDNGYGHWDKLTVDMMNKIFYNDLKGELEN